MEPEEAVVARQHLGKRFLAAANTHAIIDLLDAVFSMWSVSCQLLRRERKVGDYSYPIGAKNVAPNEKDQPPPVVEAEIPFPNT
jgi:hypothetical protein